MQEVAHEPLSCAHLQTPFPHPPSWMLPSSRDSTAPTLPFLPCFHCQLLPPLPGWRATLTPANQPRLPTRGPWSGASPSRLEAAILFMSNLTSLPSNQGARLVRAQKPSSRDRTFLLKVSDKVRTDLGRRTHS